MISLRSRTFHTCILIADAFPQDVVVGKPVRPQLAKAATDPQQALDAMKGKPFLLETKFDGDVYPLPTAPHVIHAVLHI